MCAPECIRTLGLAESLGVMRRRLIGEPPIRVTELGVEAAAATAVNFRIDAPWRSPDKFCVDRSFLFFIVDDASGSFLFSGRIVDPR